LRDFLQVSANPLAPYLSIRAIRFLKQPAPTNKPSPDGGETLPSKQAEADPAHVGRPDSLRKRRPRGVAKERGISWFETPHANTAGQLALRLAGFLGLCGLPLTGFRAWPGLMLSGLPAATSGSGLK
jgi:hypothetical protein